MCMCLCVQCIIIHVHYNVNVFVYCKWAVASVLKIRIRNWLVVFLEIEYRLLNAVILKIYRKFGQPKWQPNAEIGWKMANG